MRRWIEHDERSEEPETHELRKAGERDPRRAKAVRIEHAHVAGEDRRQSGQRELEEQVELERQDPRVDPDAGRVRERGSGEIDAPRRGGIGEAQFPRRRRPGDAEADDAREARGQDVPAGGRPGRAEEDLVVVEGEARLLIGKRGVECRDVDDVPERSRRIEAARHPDVVAPECAGAVAREEHDEPIELMTRRGSRFRTLSARWSKRRTDPKCS